MLSGSGKREIGGSEQLPCGPRWPHAEIGCGLPGSRTWTSISPEEVIKERDRCSHRMSQEPLVPESVSYPGIQGELAGTGNLGPARLLTPVPHLTSLKPGPSPLTTSITQGQICLEQKDPDTPVWRLSLPLCSRATKKLWAMLWSQLQPVMLPAPPLPPPGLSLELKALTRHSLCTAQSQLWRVFRS